MGIDFNFNRFVRQKRLKRIKLIEYRFETNKIDRYIFKIDNSPILGLNFNKFESLGMIKTWRMEFIFKEISRIDWNFTLFVEKTRSNRLELMKNRFEKNAIVSKLKKKIDNCTLSGFNLINFSRWETKKWVKLKISSKKHFESIAISLSLSRKHVENDWNWWKIDLNRI